MYRNYFLTALRNIVKSKYYFLLNMTGLILGISCFSCLFLFIKHETTFDKFLPDVENLYRVTTFFKANDQDVNWAITNGGLVPLLKDKLPEVSDATKAQLLQSDLTFKVDDKPFAIAQRTGFYTDGNFISMFKWPVLAGVDSVMLKEPNSIAITEDFAKRLFGRTDVLDETIMTEGSALKITGVLSNIPQNSHFQFDFLIAGNTLPGWAEMEDTNRGGFPVYVYFKTHQPVVDSVLTSKLAVVTVGIFGEKMKFPVQSVTKIHFNSSNLFEHTKAGNYNYVQILGIIGLLIIVSAIINYVLLSTSQSAQRAKEIGVRKTIGSTRADLIIQILVESVFLCVLAGLIAIVVIELILQNYFPNWFEISTSLFSEPWAIPAVIVLSVMVGLLAGTFPAHQIVKMDTLKILKNKFSISPSGKYSLRSVLVTMQFSLTIVVIIGCIAVLKQLSYLKEKNLGFKKDLVISIPRASDSASEWNLFKDKIKSESIVENAGTTLYGFISDYNATGISVVDEAKSDTVSVRVQWNSIDQNLIPAMGISIKEGRNFSKDIFSDTTAIIVNEAAKKKLGIDTVLDKRVLCWFFNGKPGRVIGVVNDFHFQSFDKEITPIVFFLNRNPQWEQHLLVKLNSSDVENSIKILGNNWKASGIEAPFDYSFMDAEFEKLIRKEVQLSNMILAFGILSIIIACLGLLGLVSFTTERKKLEISIRKVFGATIFQVILRMNRSFVVYIAIAFFISLPLVHWSVNKWLENFAYRMEMNYLDYLLGGGIVFCIAMMTVSLQSLNASRANPAEVLKENQ